VSYHVVNLAIHLLNALFVYRLVYEMQQTPSYQSVADAEQSQILVRFFSALLFVAHPLQTQSVTYLVQRFTSIAALFYVVAVCAFLRMRIVQSRDRSFLTARSIMWGAGTVAAAWCAFNSKEIAFTLPVMLLACEFIFFGVNIRKGIVLCTTGAVVTCGAAVKLGMRLDSLDRIVDIADKMTRVQTITSRSDYLFTQFRVVVTYIRLFFLPVRQSVEYDYVLSHSLFEPAVLGSLAILIGVITLACRFLRQSASDSRLLLAGFGIIWFFIALSIESSVLPIIDLIFEHRTYLPLTGACIATVAASYHLGWQRQSVRLFVAWCMIIALLGIATWQRNLAWRSEISLWEDATRKYPASSRAWNNLGGAYLKERTPAKALPALIRSIELDRSKAAAWNNLGLALDQTGGYHDRFRQT
jgi:hypothetical protein